MLVFLIMDFSLGFVAKKIFESQKSGKYFRIGYSMNKASSDVLIFGSSRAARHYIPEVFEKELKKPCYNAGVRGQPIIFHSTLQQIMLERMKPELIILNIDPNGLFKLGRGYTTLSDFHPYYWDFRSFLKPVLNLESKSLDYTLRLKSYQYSSTLIHAAKYFLSPQKDDKGYLPLFDKMDPPKMSTPEAAIIANMRETDEIDTNLVSAYKSFINTANDKDIKLLFVISPTPFGTDVPENISLNKIIAMADANNVPIIDFSDDDRFYSNYALFKDDTHLNDVGAHMFSKSVAEIIKKAEYGEYAYGGRSTN